MESKRQLGVKYDTAWMLKHWLLQAMKGPMTSSPSAASFSLDDVYWGGERRGGKRGRGAAGQDAAVCGGSSGSGTRKRHPIKMR